MHRKKKGKKGEGGRWAPGGKRREKGGHNGSLHKVVLCTPRRKGFVKIMSSFRKKKKKKRKKKGKGDRKADQKKGGGGEAKPFV